METARWSLFVRLFGVALIAHVVGNWGQPDLPTPVGWANLAVGLAGLALLISPMRILLLFAATLAVASVLLEMPVTGNHWLLAGLVSAAILATGGKEDRWIPTARVLLVVFYSFAAFAKLNAGFFDPNVSCAVFYANQSLAGVGFPLLNPGGNLSRALIWTTVLAEISVPITLLWRKTRYFGVVLGTVFHTVISFDIGQHFYDFTAVLVALFVLFLPDRSVEKIVSLAARVGDRLGLALRAAIGLTAGMIVVAAFPITPLVGEVLSRTAFVLWVAVSVPAMVILLRARAEGARLNWKPGVGGALIAILALLNGLTPYTEIKTAYSFNMYSNLVTSQGESNHYVVRATWPLRNGYDGPVEVLESSDPNLLAYRDQGYLIAYPQLRRYLSSQPDASLTFRRNGQVTVLSPVSSAPEIIDPGPWWWRFLPLRAIDTHSPPRCQSGFLAAL